MLPIAPDGACTYESGYVPKEVLGCYRSSVRAVVENVERVLSKGQTPNYVFSNHDEPRISSRLGQDAARSVMMLLLTLRGTPTLYYGDELGMKNTDIPRDREQDPWGKRVPGLGRDPERTPMQWDATPNAGFVQGGLNSSAAGVETWLPIGADYAQVNVATQLADPTSFLNLTRALIALRKATPALSMGSYETVKDVPEDTFVWLRKAGDETYMIAINFSAESRAIAPKVLQNGEVMLSTTLKGSSGLQPGAKVNRVTLAGFEGVVVRL